LAVKARKCFRSNVVLDKKTLYAITSGRYLGEFWLPIEFTDNVWSFLSMPDLLIRFGTLTDIEAGLDREIMDPVEILTPDILSVCHKQYKILKAKRTLENPSK
jgi:hypothetical protein